MITMPLSHGLLLGKAQKMRRTTGSIKHALSKLSEHDRSSSAILVLTNDARRVVM